MARRCLMFVMVALVLLFAAPAANAQGRGGCVAFEATAQGSFVVRQPDLPDGGWVEDVYFTIGDQVLHATAVYDVDIMAAKKSTKTVYMGFETSVVTFDDKYSGFKLVSHFTAPHQTFTTGAAMLNESGTISDGTGLFANVSGQFTDHGVYGPAVNNPTGDPNNFGVIAHIQGTMCGVALR